VATKVTSFSTRFPRAAFAWVAHILRRILRELSARVDPTQYCAFCHTWYSRAPGAHAARVCRTKGCWLHLCVSDTCTNGPDLLVLYTWSPDLLINQLYSYRPESSDPWGSIQTLLISNHVIDSLLSIQLCSFPTTISTLAICSLPNHVIQFIWSRDSPGSLMFGPQFNNIIQY
jgi:hypothetical protein